jgi:fucose 4-O-acetylase-like acetyltransferase
MASFDPARVSKPEWIGLGAGLLAFVASFLPWFTVSFSGPITVLDGYWASAWSLGFAAWFPVLLLVAGAGLLLAQHLGAEVPKPRTGWPLILLGVAVIALVIILLRWLTLPGASDFGGEGGVSYGAGFGLYVGIVAAILFGLSQYLVFRSSGQKFGDAAQQFRGGGGTGPDPAPPTY